MKYTPETPDKKYLWRKRMTVGKDGERVIQIIEDDEEEENDFDEEREEYL